MSIRQTIRAGVVAGAAAAALAASGGMASALSITGGQTAVTVTADLASLGLGAGLVGSASLSDGQVVFPITGGSTDGTDAMIEHEGSGVNLFALADSSVNVSAGNLLIDTAAATVFGDASIGSDDLGSPDISDAPFFSFGPGSTLPGVQLLITPELAGALQTVFAGAPDLTNAEFGYAVPSPEVAPAPSPVPLPAGVFLLLGALGSLGLVWRKGA